MENTNQFLKLSCVCSIAGAITTALLVYLPVPVAETFSEKVMLHANKTYMLKQWIFFIHPQLNLMAAFGIAVISLKKYPHLVIPATLFITIWAVTESAQQAFNIDAVNQIWRAGYIQEKDEAVKAALFAQLIGSEAIKDSMYFLLVFAYGMASSLFAVVLFKSNRLGKATGVPFLFFGVLSIITFAGYYLGASFFLKPADFIFAYIYPFLQPVARSMLGAWLWKQQS